MFYPLSKPEAPQSICQGWRLEKKRSLISGSSDSALSLPFAEPDFGALDLSAEIESEKLYIKGPGNQQPANIGCLRYILLHLVL